MKQLKREDLMNAHKNGCSDVKKLLENLYPDEFDKGVDIRKCVYREGSTDIYYDDEIMLWNGSQDDKFALNSDYTWEVVKYSGLHYLKPTKK